jgi:hypothetical protein
MHRAHVYEQPTLIEVGAFAERTLGDEPAGIPESVHYVWIH